MKKLFLLALFMCLAFVASAQAVKLPKGGVTQIMSAGRIVDGLELTSTGQLPFTAGQGVPFSILLLPKSTSNLKEVEVIKARYYQGDETVNIPIPVASWSVVSLAAIDIDNPTLFVNYYVYIGFGQDVQ